MFVEEQWWRIHYNCKHVQEKHLHLEDIDKFALKNICDGGYDSS